MIEAFLALQQSPLIVAIEAVYAVGVIRSIKQYYRG